MPKVRVVAEQERELAEYLLGRLSSEEQVRLEDRYMADDEVHEDLLATADDLIHAYLGGRLSPEDRRDFEGHFLASRRRRQRFEFVRTLVTAIDREPAPVQAAPRETETAATRWRRWTLAAAVLLVGIGAILATVLHRRPESSVDRTLINRPPSPMPQLSPEVPPQRASVRPSPTPKTPSSNGVRIVRIPRGADRAVEVPLSPSTRTVRLEVDVKGDRPGYDVTLETPQGSDVWQAKGLTLSNPGEPLVVNVPADVLAARGELVLSIEAEALRGP